ncbi:MAG: Mobile element protein, partial [uncultured Thermomicrobiales bacterium]
NRLWGAERIRGELRTPPHDLLYTYCS